MVHAAAPSSSGPPPTMCDDAPVRNRPGRPTRYAPKPESVRRYRRGPRNGVPSNLPARASALRASSRPDHGERPNRPVRLNGPSRGSPFLQTIEAIRFPLNLASLEPTCLNPKVPREESGLRTFQVDRWPLVRQRARPPSRQGTLSSQKTGSGSKSWTEEAKTRRAPERPIMTSPLQVGHPSPKLRLSISSNLKSIER